MPPSASATPVPGRHAGKPTIIAAPAEQHRGNAGGRRRPNLPLAGAAAAEHRGRLRRNPALAIDTPEPAQGSLRSNRTFDTSPRLSRCEGYAVEAPSFVGPSFVGRRRYVRDRTASPWAQHRHGPLRRPVRPADRRGSRHHGKVLAPDHVALATHCSGDPDRLTATAVVAHNRGRPAQGFRGTCGTTGTPQAARPRRRRPVRTASSATSTPPPLLPRCHRRSPTHRWDQDLYMLLRSGPRSNPATARPRRRIGRSPRFRGCTPTATATVLTCADKQS